MTLTLFCQCHTIATKYSIGTFMNNVFLLLAALNGVCPETSFYDLCSLEIFLMRARISEWGHMYTM